MVSRPQQTLEMRRAGVVFARVAEVLHGVERVRCRRGVAEKREKLVQRHRVVRRLAA